MFLHTAHTIDFCASFLVILRGQWLDRLAFATQSMGSDTTRGVFQQSKPRWSLPHANMKQEKTHTSFKMGSMAMPSPQKALGRVNDVKHVFLSKRKKKKRKFFGGKTKKFVFSFKKTRKKRETFGTNVAKRVFLKNLRLFIIYFKQTWGGQIGGGSNG